MSILHFCFLKRAANTESICIAGAVCVTVCGTGLQMRQAINLRCFLLSVVSRLHAVYVAVPL